MLPTIDNVFPSFFSFVFADNHASSAASSCRCECWASGLEGNLKNLKHGRDLQLKPQSLSAAWPDRVGSSLQLGARQLIEKPIGRGLFKEAHCFYVNVQIFPLFFSVMKKKNTLSFHSSGTTTSKIHSSSNTTPSLWSRHSGILQISELLFCCDACKLNGIDSKQQKRHIACRKQSTAKIPKLLNILEQQKSRLKD